MSEEIEDGMGFSGFAPSREEEAEASHLWMRQEQQKLESRIRENAESVMEASERTPEESLQRFADYMVAMDPAESPSVYGLNSKDANEVLRQLRCLRKDLSAETKRADEAERDLALAKNFELLELTAAKEALTAAESARDEAVRVLIQCRNELAWLMEQTGAKEGGSVWRAYIAATALLQPQEVSDGK